MEVAEFQARCAGRHRARLISELALAKERVAEICSSQEGYESELTRLRDLLEDCSGRRHWLREHLRTLLDSTFWWGCIASELLQEC
mmetsp:Transcript_18736/g.41669  ORF Transcript_18736/g.41669 Transcript_18736/m.41669 type:complete len:86 (-) Transcript_18736:1982-2239(-)